MKKTSIQLTESTKDKLELLKNEDDTFEDVIKMLLPEGVAEEEIIYPVKEEPAFTVYTDDCDIDGSRFEYPVSWEQLKRDKVGTVYSADCNSGCSEDVEITATIVFKDDEGVVILFKETKYHTHHTWINHSKYMVEETEEWLERFTFL